MKIQTASGNIEINKRSPFGKFVLGYNVTGAFNGNATLSAARKMGYTIKKEYPSISWFDIGKIVGHIFNYSSSFESNKTMKLFLDNLLKENQTK